MKRAKCIMIQGTMSGAGKSLLCTALCRILHQDGLRVAPFKSQNMALNSGVTADGLELGRAQIVQAEAAGTEPDARMNPILLKPSSDVGSQVIVNGRPIGHMNAAAYMRLKRQMIPQIMAAYESLAGEYDAIVIEGAGSPAEINLRENDIVNMGLAELVDAPVLLAGDIDRGGVFAQLYGTAALLTPREKSRLKGLLINRFRGDPALLRPGLADLERLCGVPVLGVVPFLSVDLDDEDSLAERLRSGGGAGPLDAAVLRLPHISNFTDFAPLESHPAFRVRYVERAETLGRPDLLLLPGTKSTVADLRWLREGGFERPILALAKSGTPVLGICGGYQMLGETLLDPDGIEGDVPELPGLGLLPCVTAFTPEKALRRVRATVDGAGVEGYEIHMGETCAGGEPFGILEDGSPEGCRAGNVRGTCLHGLFDSGELTEKLAAELLEKRGLTPLRHSPETRRAYRERQYDALAEAVRRSLDLEAVYRVMEGRQ